LNPENAGAPTPSGVVHEYSSPATYNPRSDSFYRVAASVAEKVLQRKLLPEFFAEKSSARDKVGARKRRPGAALLEIPAPSDSQ
jgi:hypothetical protein